MPIRLTFSEGSGLNDSVYGKCQAPIRMFLEKRGEAAGASPTQVLKSLRWNRVKFTPFSFDISQAMKLKLISQIQFTIPSRPVDRKDICSHH